jgi:hypothetical protein
VPRWPAVGIWTTWWAWCDAFEDDGGGEDMAFEE